MARFARVVVPGLPHHVTQRGNRRLPIFFEAGDHEIYRDLLAQRARLAGVAVWAYCLMPNHVHLVLVPSSEDGLRRAVGEAHRRYTAFVNARARWTGHLFQSRFASVVLDDAHLWAAVRYVSLNPVRAGLVERPEDWPWSSVKAHLAGRDDALVEVRPMLDRVGDVAAYLDARGTPPEAAAVSALRAAETTGRPAGDRDFVAGLERRLDRPLAPQRPGRKPAKQV
jgi:putative transposase